MTMAAGCRIRRCSIGWSIEKLQAEAETLRAEGWNWIAVATDFPYGHAAGLRRLTGETVDLTEDENASLAALKAEQDALEEQYAQADELPDEVDQRLGEIETAIAAFDNRPVRLRSGRDRSRRHLRQHRQRGRRCTSNAASSAPRTKRRSSRSRAAMAMRRRPPPPPAAPSSGPSSPSAARRRVPRSTRRRRTTTIRPLSDRLVTELTAHRTLALRDALANDPHVAFQAVLHALCLNAFYRYASNTCLEITAKHSGFSAQAPGLAETASAKAIDARHAQWAKQLPEAPAALWDALTAFDSDSQSALFAHCASLTVNVVKEPWNRRPDAFAHGDQLARTVNLDLAAAGWAPTVDNYLGRVPKARILEAVREAKGEQSAQLIDHLKKTDMAKEAERLLAGTGWLPEPLRLVEVAPVADESTGESEALPDFLAGDEDEAPADADEEPAHMVAAE